MRYRIAIGIIAIIWLAALYDHGTRGFIYFSESNYLLGVYSWCVWILLILFAGGYVSKLERAMKGHESNRAEQEMAKRERAVRDRVNGLKK